MALPNVFGVKCFCIVTGGGRGIGRAIAIALSKKITADSVIVLSGRTEADLGETRCLIEAGAAGVRVVTVTADLCDQAKLPAVLLELTAMEHAHATPADFEHCLLVNNAGSLWDVSKYIREVIPADIDSLQQYCMLNLTSAVVLTSHFLRSFPKRNDFRRTVINITSLSAILPIKSCSMYCMGKAARDMFFKTLAVEEPDVRVLSYAPGPVDTDMFRTICDRSVDQEVRGMFAEMTTSGKVLQPHQTACKLTSILEEDTYESGAHIDFFDVPE